jgi:hypothetical protein
MASVRRVAGAVGLAALIGAMPTAIDAQNAPAARTAPNAPRTPWGHPDLQGLWNAATMTPLERPANFAGRLTMTEDEAVKLEGAQKERTARLDRPSDGNRQAPPVGGDGSPGASGNVGGYNYFWIDPGDTYNRVDGQLRTSLIVDPPDGRVPPTKPEAMKRNMARLRATPTSDTAENAETRQPGAYDNIEQRPLGERCIIAFSSSSGPPMLPTYFYNNMKQVVQTKDYVMILTEMVHDVRVIYLNRSTHRPDSIRNWFGDSIGRWEGDTLVVETTNFNDKTRFRGSSEKLKVTERFNRIDDKTLLYRFTIEDPTTWDKPWTGEYTWAIGRPGDQLYEYACHEGNYAMVGIMKGARILEDEEAAQKAETGSRR